MHNGGKIIIGLAIFAILLTFPVWYSAISGKANYVPAPQIVTTEEQCVESKQHMRDDHMGLLDDWRLSVVRDGDRTYVATDGKQYEKNLVGTCMKCHDNKKDFCDQCHDYVGIEPDCWDCHNEPGEG